MSSDHCKECRERSVWFAPFQPLPHGEPQPCAGALSGKRAFGPTPAIRMTRSRPINRCTEVASVTSKKVPWSPGRGGDQGLRGRRARCQETGDPHDLTVY